jgi:uncharacterized membrane-anchored protein
MQKRHFLFLMIAFQVLILLGVFGKALYPLLIGEEAIFKVLPRDPRDIFRGNYVDLRYSFNDLNINVLPNDLNKLEKYRYGDKLYVELVAQGQFYEPAGVWKNPPQDKKFMQVIVESTYGYDTIQSVIVNAGIEAYFTDAENAKKMESLNLNDSAEVSVSVMIAPDGKARIKKINTKTIPRKSEGNN